MEFVAYGSTNRLFRDVVITEKIDGSNCVIGIEENSNRVFAGSRTKWLSNETDHFGFWHWAQENRESLIADLGPGLHRGEWFGQKMQRKYGMDHREFALFNTAKWANVEFKTPNLRAVPVLYEGVFDFNAINWSLDRLVLNGSVAAPGFFNPEGICIFHTQANIVFKVLIENDHLSKTEAGLK
jgi:hypothetical protein